MFKFLLSQFIKQNGRNPNNLEMILLRQKAANQAVDERKVVSMFDRSAVDPNKPIMGGKNIPETEEQIRQRLMDQNKKGIASMKKKLDDPEERAMGGRIGYAGGSDMGTVADSKGKTGPSKGGYQGGGTGPVERPTGGGGGNDNNTNFATTVPEDIIKKTANQAVSNFARNKIMNTLGLAKFSNPIGIAMALKGLYDQNKNPTLTEEEAMGGGITGIDPSMLRNSPYENIAPQSMANGGRIGYSVGAGKKGVQALLDLVRNKFGKKSITTADKAPIPPKTLERDMFKAADNRINKKEGVFMEDGKTPDYDYYKEILDDAEDSRGFNVAGDETIEELLRREKEIKDEYDYMYDQYKIGKLDPEPGSKSQARLNLLKKRQEEAELTGDYRLFNRDDADELDELEEFLDQDYKRVKAEQAEEQAVKELAPKMVERLKLKQKYPGITDDLLDKILIDDNPQRKAEVLGSLDETFKMMEKGMSPDEIIDAFKNQSRTKQADGGIMRSAYAGGGMGRRGFLKLLGGVGAGIAAAKTGLLKLAGKEPAKQVAKEVAQSAGSGTPPPYFFNLVNKIKTMGDDTLATQDKTIAKKYKDYVMEEDFAGNIEIIKKGDDVAGNKIEDVYMSYKVDEVPLKKGGSRKVEEYEEYTARPDMEGKMKDVEPGVPDNVIEEAMSEAPSIKKASGGIARMLGE